MNTPKLAPADYQDVVNLLSDYLSDNHDLELGQFESEFLLDALLVRLSPLLYNLGLDAAMGVIEQNVLTLEELIDLQKATS